MKETETVKAHDFETDGHANEAEVAVGAEGAASNVEEMENCSNIQNDRGRFQPVLKTQTVLHKDLPFLYIM